MIVLTCAVCGPVVMNAKKHAYWHDNRHALLTSAELLGTAAPAAVYAAQVRGLERPKERLTYTTEKQSWGKIRDAVSMRSGISADRLLLGPEWSAGVAYWRDIAFYFARLMARNHSEMSRAVGRDRTSIRKGASLVQSRLNRLHRHHQPGQQADLEVIAKVLAVRLP